MSKPRRHLFQSTFSRIFIGIVLTSTFALTIAEILSYTQLKNSFDRFASRQIIVLQQIGREFFVKEDITMPADYQNFVAEYKEEINRQVLFSFGAGLFLSLIAGALISRQITRPIAALKDIITRVTKERYSLRAPESGSLEIRELTTAFNHLIEELEQQENLRQELLADMSHELKTPITKIRGQIEGIIDGIYQPQKRHLQKSLGQH
jgi:signal transduction histidine kinase